MTNGSSNSGLCDSLKKVKITPIILIIITWTSSSMLSHQWNGLDSAEMEPHFAFSDAETEPSNCDKEVVMSAIPSRQRPIDSSGYEEPHTAFNPNAYETHSFAVCTNVTLIDAKPLQVRGGIDDLKYIKFEESTITLVPNGVFTPFTNLKELYLNNSSVNTIQPGAFTGLISLQELYLQENNITVVPQGIFNSLTKLEKLDLSSNSINIIDKHAFLGVFALQYLYLSNNKIENLTPGTFDNINGSKYIDLSHNSLFHINEGLFGNLRNVHWLDVSYNNITVVDFSVLPKHLLHLKMDNNKINSLTPLTNITITISHLDISNNLISNIEALPSLNSLNLSGNVISKLNDSLFNHTYYLNSLDLSRNLITNLGEDTFLSMYDLLDLHLQDNHLNNIPVGSFRNLQALLLLNLSNNYIDKFEFGTFAGLAKLKELDISNNKLTHLSEGCFHSLTHLNALNIGDNFLTSFNPGDLLDYTQNLRSITLSNNPWDCKILSKILIAFEHFKVVVKKGSTQKANNLHGNICSDSELDNFVTTLDAEFRNSSMYRLSDLNALNQKFKNSTFYKYFTKEFSDSEFFRYFDKTLQVRVDSNLLKLHNYFDNDFKNSTFYKFFGGNYTNPSSILQPLKATNEFRSNFVNSNAYFGPYIENTERSKSDNAAISKKELFDALKAQEGIIQATKVSSGVFLTIIIIILLVIAVLLIFKHRINFQRNIYTASKNSNSKSYITEAEAEMRLV